MQFLPGRLLVLWEGDLRRAELTVNRTGFCTLSVLACKPKFEPRIGFGIAGLLRSRSDPWNYPLDSACVALVLGSNTDPSDSVAKMLQANIMGIVEIRSMTPVHFCSAVANLSATQLQQSVD